jgi:hypothetical protein
VKDGNTFRIDPIKSGFLTKKELLESYHRAASFLHRGTLRGVLEREKRGLDPNSVMQWSAKLVTLLSHHQIYMIDPPLKPREAPSPIGTHGIVIPKRQIISLMQAEDGKVHSFMFNRIDNYDPTKAG